MPDNIAQWLKEIGLGRYARAFTENDVDFDILPDLTETNLEKLGVSLGDQKRLMRAIAALPAASTSIDEQTSASPSSAPSRAEAERRQLTVLFCDLAGSTALSSRLDPEDMRDVLRAYQDACTGVIKRYGGFVAKFMGDGVYAYFGYPTAHEDDAERAINAGLGIVEKVGSLEYNLQVRIGVATGNVAVGDIVGEGASEEAAIVGDAPNLAARLQEIAEPNTVVIGAATRVLAGELFENTDLGERNFKGFPGQIRAWAVERARRTESRFEAMRGEHLTELVGRDEEVETLLRRWHRARSGEGQVVVISGEPGIGKSRLTQELHDLIADGPHLRLRYQCSPYHLNSALHPVIEQLERSASFEPGDGDEARLDKLEAMFESTGRPASETVPLVASVLSIPADDRYRLPNVVPKRQKELTLELFVAQLLAFAQDQPGLFVFEDVHWIDPTSLELMELIVERVPDTAVLALITCRPEFDAPWIGRPRVTSMVLNRLERTDCADMIERVWGMENLSRDICDRIAAQTDGIPLFVEELTKSVLESATVSPKPGATLAVPATLQDSLEARLDRLGQAKEVAQIGSVIGREFDYDLLSRIIELDEAELNAALVELVDSGLASVRGAPSSPTYIFKHALLRDTAYASMLRGRRAEIHSAVANALDTSFPDKASTEPELLAYHYTEAGLVERAIDYWGRAGRWAAERSADVEAIVHFDKALELLATQPEGAERDLHEIQLHIAQRAPIIAVKGWAAMELERANARALTLCDRVGDVPEIFSVLYGGWVLLHTSGRITESQVWAKEIVRRAEAQEEVVPKVLGHRVLGTSLLMEGNSGGAEKYLARAWNLFGATIDEWDSFRFGSGKVAISNYRSLALWYGGLPEQAFFYAHESLTQVGELQHVNTVGHVYYHYAWLCSLASRFDDVDEYGARIIEFAERNNLEFWTIVGELLRSWASIETALGEDQITRFERRLAEYEATQMGLMAPRLNGVMATAYGKAGHADRGISIINEQLAVIEQKGQRVDQAELYRLWGELEILRGASSDAEARLLQALHVARSQSAKSWELRAATSLARLWRSLGQITEARDVLAPVYGWFTEGIDTSDLKEAKALLDELS